MTTKLHETRKHYRFLIVTLQTPQTQEIQKNFNKKIMATVFWDQ